MRACLLALGLQAAAAAAVPGSSESGTLAPSHAQRLHIEGVQSAETTWRESIDATTKLASGAPEPGSDCECCEPVLAAMSAYCDAARPMGDLRLDAFSCPAQMPEDKFGDRRCAAERRPSARSRRPRPF